MFVIFITGGRDNRLKGLCEIESVGDTGANRKYLSQGRWLWKQYVRNGGKRKVIPTLYPLYLLGKTFLLLLLLLLMMMMMMMMMVLYNIA